WAQPSKLGLTTSSAEDRQASARTSRLRYAAARAGRWGAYRARLTVDSQTRPDSAGYDKDRPLA
ncbi:MAG TPA: hypothetical protein VFO16_01865, partial [Pseudonocardiaceae bacterium]|nr:hypothetical protein [Pseudonocardiaceae bacterium]